MPPLIGPDFAFKSVATEYWGAKKQGSVEANNPRPGWCNRIWFFGLPVIA